MICFLFIACVKDICFYLPTQLPLTLLVTSPSFPLLLLLLLSHFSRGTASKNVKWCSYYKITWSFLKDLKIEALYSYIILR